MPEFFQITCAPTPGLHTFTRIDESTQLAKLEEIRGNVESRDNWDNSYIVSADNWNKIVCFKCREEIDHPGGES